jgi:hypothetical protein
MADPTEPLSEAQAHQLIWRVADGTATPEEARRLIVEFVAQADAGAVAPELFRHVVDCLRTFAQGERELRPNRNEGRERPEAITVATLDGAFGLTRPRRGKPRNAPAEDATVAVEVLDTALRERCSVPKALERVAETHLTNGRPPWSVSQIKHLWSVHKAAALPMLRLQRGKPWTPDEITRIVKLYARTPGVVLPGEAPFEGRHALP